MIFKQVFVPGLSDTGSDKLVKNKALLRYFEDTAARHSDSIQNGLNDIIDIGFSWVLLEWRLKVTDRPKYGDDIEVHTWVRNSTKLYSYRDFEVYVGGKKKAVGSSKWLLVDISTLRPVKINEDMLTGYCPEPDKNVLGCKEFDKIKPLPVYDDTKKYYIRKSDIDINGHVHNLDYIDMAYEVNTLPKEFDNVTISYKKEIKYGDDTIIASKWQNGRFYAKAENADGTINAVMEME